MTELPEYEIPSQTTDCTEESSQQSDVTEEAEMADTQSDTYEEFIFLQLPEAVESFPPKAAVPSRSAMLATGTTPLPEPHATEAASVMPLPSKYLYELGA